MDLSRIHIRRLKGDNWEICKEKRLVALKENPHFFTASYAVESARSDDYWRDMLDDPKQAVFGLFDDLKMIGLTGVFTSKYDETGKTALFGMSFIDPAYRRYGLSRLLYQARIDWAKAQNRFSRIAVSHHEGNEASKAANQKFGFQYLDKFEADFVDGKAWDYRYELKI